MYAPIRRFRDRRSSVMEVSLVLTHIHWWDKANTPYMAYVVYICFKFSFAYCACQLYLNSSKSYVRHTYN